MSRLPALRLLQPQTPRSKAILRLLLVEHKRPVADNLVARAGGVAGAAQVHGASVQPMPARDLQEAANGDPTTGALLTNSPGL